MFKSFAAYAVFAAAVTIASVAAAQTEEAPVYLDDRSTPVQLVRSYFNAIDRGEYVRAYSYIDEEFVGHFDAWQYKFDDVVKTEVSFGQMAQEGAAGSIYYQLPVTVDFEHAEGDHHIERGCISMRLVHPADQALPPFQPLRILSAELAKSYDVAPFAPAKCDSAPLPVPSASPDFLDDRSSPEQLIRSFYNAIETGDIGRAHGYFGKNSKLDPNGAWGVAMEDVSRVDLTLGVPQTDSRAGWIAYGVPVRVDIVGDTGERWTEVGCIHAYWEMPNDAEPYTPMSLGPMNLEKRPAGEAYALPSCVD